MTNQTTPLDLSAFTDPQIQEITEEMAWQRHRVLPMEAQSNLLNPDFQREHNINNDRATMTRQDYERAILLLSSLGVPFPIYHTYTACDEHHTDKRVEVQAFDDDKARTKAASLLQCRGFNVSLTRVDATGEQHRSKD